MKHLYIAAIVISITAINNVSAQLTCGTDQWYRKQLATDPSFAANQREIEKVTQEFISKGGSSRIAGTAAGTPVYTIPVVVHVVWNKAVENISDAQIMSQIDALNKDFQLLNADTINTPAPFKPLRADVKIQFCLAQRDSAGFPTTGIVRKQTSVTTFSSESVKFSSQGGSDAWPASQYLNIWVCNLGQNLLGQAPYPGGDPKRDGAVILYKAFGTTGTATAPYNLGRTVTHEVGHWLNLVHIWGDEPYCVGNDFVGDTPKQNDKNYWCPTFPHITCNNGPNGDMFMNYMDYTSDDCKNMFTLGQRDRMYAVFQTVKARASIISSKGCMSPMPDLTLTNCQVAPTSTNAGNNVVAKFQVNNIGGVAAAPNTIHFYISPDNVLTAGSNGDTLIAQHNLAFSLAAKTGTALISKELTIPLNLPAKGYYLFFVTDATNSVSEDSETNNQVSIPVTITAAPNLPDLIVQNAVLSTDTITTGVPVTVSFINKNQGLTNAATSFTSLWLSKDVKLDGPSTDINLKTNVPVPALARNESTTLLSQQITIADSVAGGPWYAVLKADGTGIINELNETNNPVFIPVTIYSGKACTPPGAPTLTYGSGSCPGTAGSLTTGITLTWKKATGGPLPKGYLVNVSRYPYGQADVLQNPALSSCFDETSLSITQLVQPGMLYSYQVKSTSDCYNMNCISSASETRYFYAPPVIAATGPTTICQGRIITLSTAAVQPGNGAVANYKWLKDGNLFQQGNSLTSVDVSLAGSYRLVIEYSGSNKCTGIAATNASEPVIISVNNISNWLGIADASWHNPLNWSCGIIPNENTKVVIQAGTSFNCTINSPAICASLTVSQGAVLKANNNLVIKH